MENRDHEKHYDERSGLWYYVHWDDRIQCFVWTIAPHQRLIVDSVSK